MKASNGMKSLPKTTILFIISLALILVVGGAYVFLFVAITNKNKSLAEFSSKNEELVGRESRLTLAKNLLKTEQPHIDTLASYFIKESEIVPFAKKIEALGAEAGTNASLELLEPGVNESGAPVLNFRLQAKGGFSEVMKLVMLLENYPTKFVWRSVNLVRDDSGSVSPVSSRSKSTLPQWVLTVSLSAVNFLKE